MFPVFVKTEVEKPVFVDKKYERPVITDKEYERPVLVSKEYERPVISDVAYERPVITDKDYEKPILVEKKYEKPVIIEKEYPIPVAKEVPYDLPIISMEKIDAIAKSAVSTLEKANDMLKDIKSLEGVLRASIDEMKDSIPKEIVMPKIIYEEYTVKDIKVVEETLHVIGKVVARSK
jgi:hypothetical protein